MIRAMLRVTMMVSLGLALLAGCGGQTGAGNDPNFSYATVVTPRPAGATCLGQGARVAKEMLNARTLEIVVAGGANPIADADWESLKPALPWVKNSTRHLLFDGSCFFRSPGAPAECTGDGCFSIREAFDHTWLLLNTVANTTCLPDAAGCSGQDVQPGFVSVNTIKKCHEITFSGPTIYELGDPAGNRYVMHATATGTPDLAGPQLPAGWTLSEKTLSEPLVILPHGGAGSCYYNIVRDNLVQSYHQYVYASERWP